MMEATLHVVDPCPWMAEVNAEAFKVLSCKPLNTKNGAQSLVEIDAKQDTAEAIAQRVRKHPSVLSAHFTYPAKDKLLGVVSTKTCSCREVGLTQFPVLSMRVLGNGVVEWRLIIVNRTKLQILLSSLEKKGIPTEIKKLVRIKIKNAITLKQRMVIQTALQFGYYNYPRKISLTKLAKLLQISPTALSETLRRGERRIVHTFLNKTSVE